ncbi:carbon-nitrogen hydrolase family protein [candidate division KSB1 bacterium]|nr:carbon-nitrogen hydrolase family protein [candidate division KSB1 bacterium]
MTTRIALAQISAAEDIQANMNKAERFMEKAAEKGAHIICFPEMGFMRFFPQYYEEEKYFKYAEPIPGPTVERFQPLAEKFGLITVLNIFENDSGTYYNTSPVLDSDGTLLGKSHMMHIAEEPNFHEKYYYHPGSTGFPIFKTNHGTIGIAICYDRHFPEHMRALAIQGAEIILIPQAGIKGNPLEFYEMEMQAASFSNQVYIGLVNRIGVEDKIEFSGGSFVTDPAGLMQAHAGSDKEELLIADCDFSLIEKMRNERPFLRDRRPEIYDILQKY